MTAHQTLPTLILQASAADLPTVLPEGERIAGTYFSLREYENAQKILDAVNFMDETRIFSDLNLALCIAQGENGENKISQADGYLSQARRYALSPEQQLIADFTRTMVYMIGYTKKPGKNEGFIPEGYRSKGCGEKLVKLAGQMVETYKDRTDDLSRRIVNDVRLLRAYVNCREGVDTPDFRKELFDLSNETNFSQIIPDGSEYANLFLAVFTQNWGHALSGTTPFVTGGPKILDLCKAAYEKAGSKKKSVEGLMKSIDFKTIPFEHEPMPYLPGPFQFQV
jgi:hypothetical protein